MLEHYLTNLAGANRSAVQQVIEVATAQNLRVFLVGGFVRDAVLGLMPDDCDVVVEGDAPTLAHKLAHQHGGRVVVHSAFRTAAWHTSDGIEIDLASARTETYPQPAVLPQVATPATIHADLQRRDFAINAIALALNGEQAGELLDPFNGQSDLQQKIVRVLHPRSFIDDPTRLFRAVRYEQRLGFAIAPDTLALLPEAWFALELLSADRLRHEFEIIFTEAQAAAMLARLMELEVLSRIYPALRWAANSPLPAGEGLGVRGEILPLKEWRVTTLSLDVLYWALLVRQATPDEAARALRRLNVSPIMVLAVREALTLTECPSQPSAAVAVLDKLSELGIITAYLLHPSLRPTLHTYLAHWRWIQPTLTGHDLQTLGLTPGPAFRPILWQLRAARLDGVVEDEAGERQLLQNIVKRESPLNTE